MKTFRFCPPAATTPRPHSRTTDGHVWTLPDGSTPGEIEVGYDEQKDLLLISFFYSVGQNEGKVSHQLGRVRVRVGENTARIFSVDLDFSRARSAKTSDELRVAFTEMGTNFSRALERLSKETPRMGARLNYEAVQKDLQLYEASAPPGWLDQALRTARGERDSGGFTAR